MILTMAEYRGLKGRDRLLLHIERTGQTIAGDIVWTTHELDILRQLYPDRFGRIGRTAAPHRRRNCA